MLVEIILQSILVLGSIFVLSFDLQLGLFSLVHLNRLQAQRRTVCKPASLVHVIITVNPRAVTIFFFLHNIPGNGHESCSKRQR